MPNPEQCKHKTIESNMTPEHCVDCGALTAEQNKWEERINDWLKSNYSVSPDYRMSLIVIIRNLLSQTRQQTENERDENIGGWLKYELKEFNGGCGVCGGRLVEIRGRYPKTPDRKVCPTCLMEIRESVISNLYPNNQNVSVKELKD